MNTMIWLALGFFIPVLGQTLQTEVPTIDASLPECDLRQNSLFCDFQDSSIDTIYLDRTNKTFGIIYVYNIAKLHLNEKSCTNLALNNIGRVEIAETEPLEYTCSREIKLTAKDTLFSEIPGNTKEIDLENCTLLSWTTVSSLTKASILNSRVEVLNAYEPLMNAASFTVDGSSIGILQKLVLNGSEFSMRSTKIDFISPGGFVVQQGLAKLENCSLQNASVDSFLIHPKATLLLQNISGNLRISHEGKPSDGRSFIVENTANENNFFTEFVVVFSALVITMVSCLGIIFVHCIKERACSSVHVIKDQTTPLITENDAKVQNKDEQISLLDKNSPSERNSSFKDLDKNRERKILTVQGASREGDDAVTEEHLKEGDDAVTKEQLTAPPYQDDVSDKVIIFKCYYLAGQDCEIGDLLRRDKIKIALRESIFDWEEIKEKLVSRKRYLSEFQVIEIKATEFHSLRNGATPSMLRKKIQANLEGEVTHIKRESSLPPHRQSLSRNDGALNGGDVTLTKKQLSLPYDHQSQPTHEGGAVKGGDVTLTDKQLSLSSGHQFQSTHEGALKGGDVTSTDKQLSSSYDHQLESTHEGALKGGDVTSTDKQLSSSYDHQLESTHEGALKGGDVTSTNKQLSSSYGHQFQSTHKGALKGGDVTSTDKQLSLPYGHQFQSTHEGALNRADVTSTDKQLSSSYGHHFQSTHEGALKGGDVTLTDKQLSLSSGHQFQPTHEGAVKGADVTSTDKQLSSPPSHQPQTKQEGTAKESNGALTSEQLKTPPHPDNLSDKIIIFKTFSLAGQESDIADALEKGKIRIGLKQNTYNWEEIEAKLLSRRRYLSEFQVMKVTTTELHSIQNGEALSTLTEKVPGILAYVQNKSDFHTAVERATSEPPASSSMKYKPPGYRTNSRYSELLRYWDTNSARNTNNELLANLDNGQEEGESFAGAD